MEFWAQRTISPLDGRVGWTVVDDRYDEHARAGQYLQVLLDGEGRSVGTARTYAGRLALYLTWASTVDVDEAGPSAGQLACFARWLERTPSRKHRPGTSLAPLPGPGGRCARPGPVGWPPWTGSSPRWWTTLPSPRRGACTEPAGRRGAQ